MKWLLPLFITVAFVTAPAVAQDKSKDSKPHMRKRVQIKKVEKPQVRQHRASQDRGHMERRARLGKALIDGKISKDDVRHTLGGIRKAMAKRAAARRHNDHRGNRIEMRRNHRGHRIEMRRHTRIDMRRRHRPTRRSYGHRTTKCPRSCCR